LGTPVLPCLPVPSPPWREAGPVRRCGLCQTGPQRQDPPPVFHRRGLSWPGRGAPPAATARERQLIAIYRKRTPARSPTLHA